ncbi:hypothetical protein NP493_95g01019 [Ridgeia piscesae]|uniref:Uncharacterized protein n=1 Tax=Ridgeia piscesae TaxID=27915 RepID=A0AAD9P7Y5_RIDPI|nr:hypothetical protein NP493_95g01019 [Ridgeia piscesae]
MEKSDAGVGNIDAYMATIEGGMGKKTRQKGPRVCTLTTFVLILVGIVFVGLAVSVVVSLYAAPGISDGAASDGHAAMTDGNQPGPQRRVVFTFENIVTNDRREFRATTDVNTTRETAYEIMRDIEKTDTRFRFTTKEHKTFGHFVTQVRGVKADWTADKTYWAFLKRTSTVDCSVSMGVSSYIPADGEHLVLSLVKSPNNLKSCASLAKTTTPLPDGAASDGHAAMTDGNQPGPQRRVVFTFENIVTNDRREFRATADVNTTRETAYEIMRDIEKTDTRFRFTTKEHKTFGHFVTQVRGVKADWTADKTYWAFLKRTSTVDCSVSMGVSSYIPADGEHLVLSLVKSPNNLKSCASLAKTTTPLPETITTA